MVGAWGGWETPWCRLQPGCLLGRLPMGQLRAGAGAAGKGRGAEGGYRWGLVAISNKAAPKGPAPCLRWRWRWRPQLTTRAQCAWRFRPHSDVKTPCALASRTLRLQGRRKGAGRLRIAGWGRSMCIKSSCRWQARWQQAGHLLLHPWCCQLLLS